MEEPDIYVHLVWLQSLPVNCYLSRDYRWTIMWPRTVPGGCTSDLAPWLLICFSLCYLITLCPFSRKPSLLWSENNSNAMTYTSVFGRACGWRVTVSRVCRWNRGHLIETQTRASAAESRQSKTVPGPGGKVQEAAKPWGRHQMGGSVRAPSSLNSCHQSPLC